MEKENTIEKLKNEIFSEIYGYNIVKESILLQLVSKNPFNILLIGGSSSGKSMFIDSIKRVYTDFINIKNKEKIEILSNNSFCIIDGIERLDPKFDLLKFIENKNFLAVANPILGRFDPFGNIGDQISMSPRIISKFDLVYIIRDIPDRKRDELIIKQIYDNYLNPKIKTINSNILKELIDLKNKDIEFNDEVLEEVNKFYINLRNKRDDTDEIISIPINSKQILIIFKLIENYTKLNNKKIGDKIETKNAIKLLMYCLKEIGVNPKTGELDIYRFETGMS